MRVRSSQIVVGVLVVIIALVFALVIFGPEAPPPVQTAQTQEGVASAQNTPQMVLEKEFVDMGLVSNTETSKVSVAVRNEGTAPLIISDVRGSCSCIWGKMEESTIPPGGASNLIIELDPFQIPGFSSKKLILIHSNDESRKVANMDVVAKIDPEFSFKPDTLQFGTIEKGQTPEASAILRQIRDEPIEIREIQVHGPQHNAVEVTHALVPEQEWETPGKQEFKITVRILPTIGTGRIVVPIDIFTNIERFKTGFRTALMAEVTTFYKTDPERVLQVSRVQPGATSVARITVTAERPISLQEATSSIDAVKTRILPDPEDPNKAYIDFDIAPDAAPGRIKGRLAFVIESEGQTYQEELLLYGLVSNGEAVDDPETPMPDAEAPEASEPPTGESP